jgi:adenosylmethionine-8-amino-7-oxononanoate aminotransferase
MTAVELVKDQATHENFNPTLNVRVVEIAYENGLITRPLIGDSLQLSPPLSVSAEEIDAIVKILGDAIAQAYAELG